MKLKTIGLAIALTLTSFFQPAPTQAGILMQARHYVGLHETRNRKALKRLLGINPAHQSWCGAFVAAVVRKAGKQPPSASNQARSWLHYGNRVSLRAARAGDIVVLRLRHSYHVAILSAIGNGAVRVIGGNQNNRVQISVFSASAVVAIRR